MAIEKIQKIKKHISNYREAYLASSLTGLSVVAVFLVVGKPDSSIKNAQQIRQIAWRPKNNQVIINLVERSTPSKPVHLVGTNLYFDSLSDAARKTGYSLSSISKVINGHKTDINGDVFEVLKSA